MSLVARMLSRFDDALDWPEDLFLSDDQPAEDWIGRQELTGAPTT